MTTILNNDVLAYIKLGRREVALSMNNNRKHNVAVKKLFDRDKFSELVLGENEFELELKVDPEKYDVTAYIKSPKFPNPVEGYKVINFLKETSYQILSEVENKNGVFNNKFEALFIDTDKVSFICDCMSNYKKVEDEMVRRFYTEIGKKTKKWIPGHRYDNEEGTMYYLGSYLSKKKDEFNSKFYNTIEDMKVVHLYVNSLEGEKNISEVFDNKTYEDINVIWEDSLPSCVDSGKVLEDDSPSLYNLYERILDNSIGKVKNQKAIFDCLCYQSLHDPVEYPESLTSKIEGIVDENIKSIVFDNWNVDKIRVDRHIGDKEDLETNLVRIKAILLTSVKDGNILGKFYYEDLFKALGINIDSRIEKFLKGWNEKDLSSDWTTFRNNFKYFLHRSCDLSKIQSVQRQGEKEVKISDLFGTGILTQTILELVDYANNNFGEGVSEYNVIKVSKSSEVVSCRIELDDLLNFKDTEDLEEDILRNKFAKLVIYFDKGKILE